MALHGANMCYGSPTAVRGINVYSVASTFAVKIFCHNVTIVEKSGLMHRKWKSERLVFFPTSKSLRCIFILEVSLRCAFKLLDSAHDM